MSQSLAKNVLVEFQHLMGLCKNFLYIFHLFHYTINIIKKGATVLQNVSKTYLVYKNESGLSSVEAAAAAAATEAWWAAILSLRSECNLFKFSIWLAPPEIISGIINYRKEQTNVMAYLLPIHNRVSDMSNNRATNFIIFEIFCNVFLNTKKLIN